MSIVSQTSTELFSVIANKGTLKMNTIFVLISMNVKLQTGVSMDVIILMVVMNVNVLKGEF
jgi:hypothetical protein